MQRRIPCSDGVIVFRSPAEGTLHSLVADHVVQGRVIFPGMAYLETARAAAAGSAVHGVFFLQPLAVEASGLMVECSVDGGRFQVRSSEDAVTFADAAVHCTGSVDQWEELRQVDQASLRARSCARPAHLRTVYDAFYAMGLHYGPKFRTLTKAWAGVDDALSRLRVRMSLEGTKVHPADLDDALGLTGIQSLAFPASGGSTETRLPYALDGALLQGESGNLWAVRRHSESPVLDLLRG